MATLMDIMQGYTLGGAPTDDNSESLGSTAKQLYQNFLNKKNYEQANEARKRLEIGRAHV